jgi:hypothetical protein
MAMPRITAFNDSRTPLGAESNRAKKMVEGVEAGYFLDACSLALDRDLAVLSSSERPDFVCAASDGSAVGLELVKVVRDPQSKWADEVFFDRLHMEPGEVLWRIAENVREKESKRSEPDWKFPDSTILVVQVMDCPLRLFRSELHPDCLPHHGFEEIWLADYSELDAYGNVELFCMHPTRLWGYYPSTRGKPYG